MLKLILSVALVGTLAYGQEHPCVAPMHFESMVLQYDHYTNFYRRGRMLYDGIGERVRYIEETAENQTRPSEDILILFRQRKEYVVDLKSKKCVASVPKYEFHRIGVEEGYHFVERLRIGSESDGVGITVWYKNENSTDASGISVAEFTERDCIPTYHSFEGEVKDQKVHYHRSYFDVRLGEHDPNAFDIPKECTTQFDETLF